MNSRLIYLNPNWWSATITSTNKVNHVSRKL